MPYSDAPAPETAAASPERPSFPQTPMPSPRAHPPQRRTPAAGSCAAFSLLEVLCVVTILGICSAIVVPLVGNTADVRLAAAQRKVLADLQYAQGMAIAGRQSVYVRCVADKYDLCTLAGGVLSPVAHPINPGKFIVGFGSAATERSLKDVSLTLPTFGFSDRTLGFDPTGVPFTYSELTNAKSSLATRSELRVTASGLSRSVYVEAFTGELRVP